MQTPSSPPAPPAAPAAPPSPTAVGGAGAATTTAPALPTPAPSIAYLRARRSELSSQLNSASGRRENLLEELKTADAAARPGLEERLAVLDKRMVQLETDIAENGRQLAATATSSGLGGLVAGTAPATSFGGLSGDQVETLGGLSIVLVFMPLAVAASRFLWKRGNVARVPPPALVQTADRLGHLEQAVDAIAIEVERVSEGQRFMTRLLSEASPAAALGAGQRVAEPVRARDAESAAVRGRHSDG